MTESSSTTTRPQRHYHHQLLLQVIVVLLLPILLYLASTQYGLNIGSSQSVVSSPFAHTTSTTASSRASIPLLGPANGASWWEPYVEYLARPFPAKVDANNQNWCILTTNSSSSSEEEFAQNEKAGIWFIKNYKAASSTGAGVTARIAHNAASRQRYDDTPCRYSAGHEFADGGGHTHGRNWRESILWSLVRHPSSRVLSGFAYFRGGQQEQPNIFKAYANSERSGQVRLLDSWPNDDDDKWGRSVAPNKAAARIQQSILYAYDFVGVQERMEESLVVLKLLLDLDDWDIIVLPAKRQGSYALDPRGVCALIPNSQTTSQEVKAYLAGDFERGNYDYLLYAAVNRSLDLTIEYLGRDRVEAELERHQQLQKMAEDICLEEAFFPCSSNGTRQPKKAKESCYHQDWGCGYQCLDRLKEQGERR